MSALAEKRSVTPQDVRRSVLPLVDTPFRVQANQEITLFYRQAAIKEHLSVVLRRRFENEGYIKRNGRNP